MSLDLWQKKLEDQFKLLCEVRKDTPNKNPVFALEHGLTASEVECLKADIRAYVALHEPLDQHWLPWAVYAAEIGYLYDGQEYWITFEANTAGWSRFHFKYRSWIKKCYLKFRDAFNGAEPSGRWAQNFQTKNISWPILHAILPHDLQSQLVKALYDYRAYLLNDYFEFPELLGEFLSTHCRRGSRRFVDFLSNEPLLVGQISVALLLQGHKISEDLLLKETQARIIADLGKEQRQWLEHAQHHAVITYKGLRRQYSEGDKTSPTGINSRPTDEIIRIENTPFLQLYPKSSSLKEFQVKLGLQDLTSLVTRFPKFRTIVAENYSVIAGTSGASQARGLFLRPGPHKFTLVRWPIKGETLISFNNAPDDLNVLLSLENLFPPENVILFKLSSDNIGYEIRRKNVRPDETYILLSQTPIQYDDIIIKPFKVDCKGVNAAFLEIPSEISAKNENAIESAGLTCAKSLKVWPVGFPAKEWDGDGYGIWLAGDKVRIGLRAGYELSGIEVDINGTYSTIFDESSVNHGTTILDLSPLPIGKNIIKIKVMPKYQSYHDLFGYLTVVIKEPQVWDIKTANQGALRGSIDPEFPSLEEIWGNDIELELFGPAGRNVKSTFRLYDKMGDKLREKDITGLTLPLYCKHWRSMFSEKVKADTQMESAFDVAWSGDIVFDAEEIGSFTVKGERKTTPIRWVVQTIGQQKLLRYINDTDDENIQIAHYDFINPDVPLKKYKVNSDQTIDFGEGGLFRIQNAEGYGDSIVMTKYRAIEPAELILNPRLTNIDAGDAGVEQLISLYSLWEQSRTSGNILSQLRRSQVLKGITCEISLNLGGERWAKAEQKYHAKKDERTYLALKACIADRREEYYLGAVLERDAEKVSVMPTRERKNYFERLLRRHFHIPEDQAGFSSSLPNPEFILKLLSVPSTLLSLERDKLRASIALLRQYCVMARAGRFFILAVERFCAEGSYWENCSHHGWRW